MSALVPMATTFLDVRFHLCSDRGLIVRSGEEFVGGIIGIEEHIREPGSLVMMRCLSRLPNNANCGKKRTVSRRALWSQNEMF